MESLPSPSAPGSGLGIVNQIVGFNVSKESVNDVVFLIVILVALLFQRRRSGGPTAPTRRGRRPACSSPSPTCSGACPRSAAARIGLGAAGPRRRARRPLHLRAGAHAPVHLHHHLRHRRRVPGGALGLGRQHQPRAIRLCRRGRRGRRRPDLEVQRRPLPVPDGGGRHRRAPCRARRAAGPAHPRPVPGVTTLALAVAVNSFFLNPTNFEHHLPASIIPPVLWKRVDLASGRAYYFFCLAVLLLVIAFVKGMRKARAGRVLLAVRDNERASAAMAVPNIRVKLGGFMLAGAIAGVAGGLHATALGAVGQGDLQPGHLRPRLRHGRHRRPGLDQRCHHRGHPHRVADPLPARSTR